MTSGCFQSQKINGPDSRSLGEGMVGMGWSVNTGTIRTCQVDRIRKLGVRGVKEGENKYSWKAGEGGGCQPQRSVKVGSAMRETEGKAGGWEPL